MTAEAMWEAGVTTSVIGRQDARFQTDRSRARDCVKARRGIEMEEG